MSALESLWDQATNFQMFTMYSTEELRRLVAPHEYLVDVAEREDAAQIACAVSQHIAEARANLLRKLGSHQPSAVSRQPLSAGHGGTPGDAVS
jgi:DNA-binding GntR family transcriptional regulator